MNEPGTGRSHSAKGHDDVIQLARASSTGGTGRGYRQQGGASRGFTLVELLVVMAIITMAAGLMTPAIADFFRNRAIDRVKGEMTSALRRARLKAVTEGRKTSVVFFREGPRIYDEVYEIFADPRWRPSDSSLANDKNKLWFELGFADDIRSDNSDFEQEDFEPSTKPYVPSWEWYERRQERLREQRRSQGAKRHDLQYDITGLAKVTFQRDGTLRFGPGGNDVRSVEFRKDDPQRSDIAIYQLDNRAVGFIDLKRTGAADAKIVVRPEKTYMEFDDEGN